MKNISFIQFRDKVRKHFEKMTKDIYTLYEASVDKDVMWDIYLDNFPEGTNEIYRERRFYDCNCCKSFIRKIGAVVTIKDGKITTIWDDLNVKGSIYEPVAKALSEYVKGHNTFFIYKSNEKTIGTKQNFSDLHGEVEQYDHFYLELEDKFVGYIDQGEFNDRKNVFKRGLNEISLDALDTVLELIAQNSLYKGEEWEQILKEFKKYKKAYSMITDSKKRNLFALEMTAKTNPVLSKLRNHSIGVLLIDISNGVELEEAVKRYEKIVAPANYKRPKAIFTKKMLEEAQKTVTELGYLDSLPRRFANINDITVNNVLFVDRNLDSVKNSSLDVFGELGKELKTNPKKFNKTQEITIKDFINNVLPTASSLEVLLESKHEKNLVSLIAPVNKDSKSMFKWNNNFSWAYSGNLADSDIKQNVKSAGGNVEGVLRFSIQWNDDEFDNNDLDAHAIEPRGNEIYFSSKKNERTGGNLDIDIINPQRGVPAVENITWPSIDKMEKGTYKFFVNNYTNRKGRSGFRAEIEFNGEIYKYVYNKPLKQDENVYVAYVTLDENNNFSIDSKIPADMSNRQMWNLSTNKFIPVRCITMSPNYWNEQKGIGNKHYFFMLDNCINDEEPNGFFNEYLKQELLQHKRVFEALGSKMKAADTSDQLSGLGFCSTRPNDLIVKVKGSTERILKIKF